MTERKKELRKRIAQLKTLHSLSTTRLAQSKQIFSLLEEHPAFQKAKTILLYYALSDEVETQTFIAAWSGKKTILLPRITGDELELKVYQGAEHLQQNSYGIDEPVGESFSDYSAIDLAIVPGVAFDNQGHRLGRGKGYYDRLLPQLSAYKIGVCFPFQLVDDVPTDPFDIAMDEVICG
jgi:5-formyltetrahydrofolate cyclo-ligase